MARNPKKQKLFAANQASLLSKDDLEKKHFNFRLGTGWGPEKIYEVINEGLDEESDDIFLKKEPLESEEININLVDGGDTKPTFHKEPEHPSNAEGDFPEEEFGDIVFKMKPRRVETMRVKIKVVDNGRAKPKPFFDDILEDPATEF